MIILTALKRSSVLQIYSNPFSSNNILCTINVATVLDNSLPRSMILKHKGIISVPNKNLITSGLSTFTRAPITPNAVSLKYSKGLVLLTVLRKGYKKIGICAFRKAGLVSG